MKKNKFLSIIIIGAAAFLITSCKKDFLKETLTTARTTDFYKTDAGILQLSVGTAYQTFNAPFNGEWNYAATNYGTDEFHIGGDPSNSPWNNYDATFNSSVVVVNGNNHVQEKDKEADKQKAHAVVGRHRFATCVLPTKCRAKKGVHRDGQNDVCVTLSHEVGESQKPAARIEVCRRWHQRASTSSFSL